MAESDVRIRVRGEAERSYPPERATVRAAVALQDPDRETVRWRAIELVEHLRTQLRGYDEANAVTTWSCDEVRVLAERPRKRGEPQQIIHHARMGVRAEFVDFEALADWVSSLVGVDGVEVRGIGWDVDPARRRGYESELRREAVHEARTAATAYAEAIGRESVQPTSLADAGMLGDDDPVEVATMAAAAEPERKQLRLKPRDISIRMAVDAEFRAR